MKIQRDEKSTRKNIRKEFKELKTELLFEQVSAAVKDHPKEWRHKLEELGFEWHDDEGDEEQDIKEENESKPKNRNQETLVAYFEGEIPLSDHLFELFEKETTSDNANGPLLRKYFKRGNKNLKKLILSALSEYPTNERYLLDLVYFHEHNNSLKELIDAYQIACIKEDSLIAFEDLARNFWFSTASDDYDALYALNDLLKNDSDKLSIVEKLLKEREEGEEDIEF